MPFDLVIGQQTPRDRLMEALIRGRLAHAYLLHGPAGTGAEALAIELAKAVNCLEGIGEPCQTCRSCRRITALQHPDVHVYTPVSSAKTARGGEAGDGDEEGMERAVRADARMERRIAMTGKLAENPYAPLPINKNDFHSVDDIRGLRQEANSKPYEGRRKVMIIVSADRLNINASNALLKTLEEPPGELLLILTTHRPHHLLPTILSRCQPVHLRRLDDDTIERALIDRYATPPPRASLAARQADGSLSMAIKHASPEGDRRQQMAGDFIECIHTGDVLRIFDAVENISAMHKEQPVMESLFDAMLGYYRDLFVLLAAPSDTDIMHVDRAAWLHQTAERLGLEQIETGIAAIETAKHHVSRNAYPQLTLTVLALRLRPLD